MVIDASCIKSLGRAHQLPLSSKKKGCTFVFLHENDSRSPQLVLIFPFCDPGASANGWAVSGGGAAHVLLGGGEGPSVPRVSSHVQIPGQPPKHLPLHRRIMAAAACPPYGMCVHRGTLCGNGLIRRDIWVGFISPWCETSAGLVSGYRLMTSSSFCC